MPFLGICQVGSRRRRPGHHSQFDQDRRHLPAHGPGVAVCGHFWRWRRTSGPRHRAPAPDGKRGVHGRQVSFNYYDDGFNPVNSVQLQRQLIEQDKVFAVVASVGTEVNQAVQPFLNEAPRPARARVDRRQRVRQLRSTRGRSGGSRTTSPRAVSTATTSGGTIPTQRSRSSTTTTATAATTSAASSRHSATRTCAGRSWRSRRTTFSAAGRRVAADSPACLRCRHADGIRHDHADDPDVRHPPRAELEAGQHLRQLGLDDGHGHGDRRPTRAPPP